MKVLLLGKTGQLGWELHRTLQPLGDIVALAYPEIDMSNAESIRNAVRFHAPNVIVNATAYTAVDKAESESALAYAVNAEGPRVLAEEARQLNALLVHFSTDYVFDGAKNAPYLETDTPNPLSVYGKSKLAGEQAVQSVGGIYLVLRTAWVYSKSKDSFAGKVLQWARQNETLKVVSDQVSNPTWARMLAEITAQVLAKGGNRPVSWLAERRGLYHLAGSGRASRLEWAQAILSLDPRKEEQVAREILPALTADFPSPAQRPLYSALNCDKFTDTFGLRLPDWQDALRLLMEAG